MDDLEDVVKKAWVPPLASPLSLRRGTKEFDALTPPEGERDYRDRTQDPNSKHYIDPNVVKEPVIEPPKPWEAANPDYKAPTPAELGQEQLDHLAAARQNSLANRERRKTGQPCQFAESTKLKAIQKGIDLSKLESGEVTTTDFQGEYHHRALDGSDMRISSRLLADRFVSAWFECFNAKEAFLRAGGDPRNTKWANSIFRWPYVQNSIQTVMERLEEDEIVNRKGILLGLLKEANYHGDDATQGARVRAWMGLARIKKMDVQVTEQNVNVRGGVMVIHAPKEAETIEGWAQLAEDSQTALKDEVRK